MTRTLPAAASAALLALCACHKPDPNSVEDQVGVLKKSRTTREKERALENLRRMARKEAVPGLVAALPDASAKIKGQIAVILGELKDPAAVKGLAEALEPGGSGADVNTANKEIARALGDIGGPEASRPLLQLLKATQDNFVRMECVTALGRLKDAAAVPQLSELASDESVDALFNKKALLALAEINDPGALPVYLRMLFFERGSANKVSFYPESSFAIFKLGARAQDRVLAMLKGEDKELMDFARAQKVLPPAVYAKAAQIEADLQDARAVPALVGLLKYEDAVPEHKLEVRKNAADALGRMRAAEAGPALAAMLGEDDPVARSVYVRSLVQIGDASVTPKLAACARQGSFGAREFCMLGVLLLAGRADAREFDGFLKAEPALFDKECKEQGGEVDCPKVKDETVAARAKVVAGYQKLLEAVGGCADPKCLEAQLSDAEPVARERAAYELGRRGATAALPALFTALKRDVKDVIDLNPRYAAICAVDWLTAASPEARKAAAAEVPGLKALVKADEKRPLTQRIAEEVLRLAYKLERP